MQCFANAVAGVLDHAGIFDDFNILIIFVYSVKTIRSTLHRLYNMTHNSLPLRAAMTHTRCHAGQRQQPGLAQRKLAARNNDAKCCKQSEQLGLTSQALTRWGHQNEVELL